MTMTTSAAGRAYIESKEGCRLEAYRDIVGVLTIGYGCTGRDVFDGQVITQAEADQMLSDRLAQDFEPSVNHLIGDAPTTQGQFDAMVSLAFNIGVGAFAQSSVLRLHCAKDYDDAADAFLMWNKAGGREVDGLTNRRTEEGQMYMDASP
jgi:lysozyme